MAESIFWKNKNNSTDLSSTELAQRVVKDKGEDVRIVSMHTEYNRAVSREKVSIVYTVGT